jgi:hypothetical protein
MEAIMKTRPVTEKDVLDALERSGRACIADEVSMAREDTPTDHMALLHLKGRADEGYMGEDTDYFWLMAGSVSCPACAAGFPKTYSGRHHPGYNGKRFYKCRG